MMIDLRYIRAFFLFSGALSFGAGLSGCKRGINDEVFLRESAVRQLKERTKSEDPVVQRGAKKALSKLENGVVDAEPILVAAGLSVHDAEKTMSPELVISCLDEDRDLYGWCIREEHRVGNGALNILEERYPVYAACPTTPIFLARAYRVEVRSRNQRKDEQAWQEYVAAVLDKIARSGSNDSLSSAGEPQLRMPTVWISIPEPNQVRVLMSIYDRAGHESQSFEIKVPSRLARDLKEAYY